MNVGRISPLSFGHMSSYWNEEIECAKDINTNTVNNETQETRDAGVSASFLQKNNRLGIVNPDARYMYIQYESDIKRGKNSQPIKPLSQDSARKTVKKNENIRAITEFDENGNIVTRREFMHDDRFEGYYHLYQEHCAFFSPQTGNLTRLASFNTNSVGEYFLDRGEFLREDGSTKRTISQYEWGKDQSEIEYEGEDNKVTRQTYYDDNGDVKEDTVYYGNGDWTKEKYTTFNGCRLHPYPDKIIEHDGVTGEDTEYKYLPKGPIGKVTDEDLGDLF